MNFLITLNKNETIIATCIKLKPPTQTPKYASHVVKNCVSSRALDFSASSFVSREVSFFTSVSWLSS